jgi:phage tail sheath protein FI
VLASQTSGAPGVYYQRVDASLPRINPLRTDVAGFVGIATRGPLHTAVPVLPWRQFQAYFGDFTGAGFLAYAVRAFFENGGRKCRIVRVASEAVGTAARFVQGLTVSPGPGQPPPRLDFWRIAAFSPGVWGNNLEITLRETHRSQTSTDPKQHAPEASGVESITGFTRGTHVRLSQDSATTAWKVVSDVDAVQRRLIWVHEKSEAHLPYDAPLAGFDPNRPITIESVEYTLIVRELGRLIHVYEALSLVPEHARYGPRVLAPLIEARGSGVMQGLPAAPEPIVIEEWRGQELTEVRQTWIDQGLRPLAIWDEAGAKPLPIVSEQTLPLVGGADGLAQLRVGDFIGAEVDPLESDAARQRKLLGLRALEDVDEVAMLAVPDIHLQPRAETRYAPPPPCIPDPCLPSGLPMPAVPRVPAVGDLPPVFSEADIYQVQAAMVQQCEKRRDRIALLDPPFTVARDDALGVGAIRAWRHRFESKYAALYYPWLRVVDPLRLAGAITREIPPSGHVAGQYAQTDAVVGVHKALANAPLVWTQDVTVAIDDATHGVLNPEGINVIRALAGRGLRIFGARTTSSDPDWRFVNVRRLLMMIEKAIDVATQWAVFEPNDVFTRTKLHLALTSFLLTLWQQGALAGEAANEAFFVKCDEENNPPSAREQGRLLADVGVAPVQPFEFIILRVGRVDNAFEITEAEALAVSKGER